jgi:hypothetical protein
MPVQSVTSEYESVNLDLLPYYRWEHRVTIGYNGRRYMVFLDNLNNTAYVEDCTHDLKKIEDESLWQALIRFATTNGYLDMMVPMTKNKEERFI